MAEQNWDSHSSKRDQEQVTGSLAHSPREVSWLLKWGGRRSRWVGQAQKGG